MKRIICWGLSLFFWHTQAVAGIPIQHWTLDNGAKVYLVEVPGLPMVDMQVEFDAGTRRDGNLQGLSSATASMMAKGLKAVGSQPALDENALGEAWADLGAMVGASSSSDRMSLSLRSLTRTELLDAAVDLASRQLAHPSFPSAIWQNERERWVASIKEANTKPATLASRAYNKALFADHPYGAEVDEASLRRIDTTLMAQFHAKHFKPCLAKVSIVGALTRAQAQERVKQLLQHLPVQSTCPSLPAVPEVQALKQAQTLRIPFESAQAHVFIGQVGISRQHPDYLALTVGNYVLGGGGFVSRLTEEVREKRGLSYSVYSYFGTWQQAGPFTVGLQTRPDQAEQAVKVATDVVAEFVKDGPTDKELKAAKDFLIGGFALRLDSNRKLMDNLSNIAWYDLPLDYLDTWSAQVDKLTTKDIQQAFARNLQPDRMVTLMLGAQR
jgi:zinc protease